MGDVQADSPLAAAERVIVPTRITRAAHSGARARCGQAAWVFNIWCRMVPGALWSPRKLAGLCWASCLMAELMSSVGLVSPLDLLSRAGARLDHTRHPHDSHISAVPAGDHCRLLARLLRAVRQPP